MSAREDLIYRITRHCSAETAEQLVGAYLSQVLRAAADDVLASDLGPRPGHSQDYGNGWSDATHRASSRLLARAQHAGEKASAPAPAATPTFFEPGHVYTRQHHGQTIEFHVRHIATAPDADYPTAFGFRRAPDIDAMTPFDSDDLTGWTDTEAGGQ